MGEDGVFYFAFGSNMLSSIFSGTRTLRPASVETATLRGYRLAFTEPGIPYFEPAFANIEKAPGAVCEGVLYCITADDLAHLDFTEGRGAYDIIDVAVVGSVSDAVTAKAFASKITMTGLLPTKRYLQLLIDGAREKGLSSEWIRMLESQPSLDRSRVAWLTPFLMKYAPVPLIMLRNIRITKARKTD